MGLITAVVDDEQLEAESRALAARIASGPLGSHRVVKKLLLTSYTSGLEEQMELEGRHIAACEESTEGREDITALLEKRKPAFG